ncbi:hypothetical protein [Chengkuizengella sediminis]|uniref:hypothetical protein n=1 Tax=Chengkuizengella sediminis TaxID=1885917 RepID=UPI00138964E6|nr:hypothetical protein [Chengkuizengella sediminis]NDI35608.1 hypothetical protein [Chengkuizengella sediminis]
MKVLKKSHYIIIMIIVAVTCILLISSGFFTREGKVPNELPSNRNEIELSGSVNSDDLKLAVQLKNDILKQLNGKEYNASFSNDEYEVNISEEYINKWIERIAINKVMSGKTEDIKPEEILEDAISNALRYEVTLIMANLNNIDMSEGLYSYIEGTKEEMMSIDTAKKITDELVDGLGLEDVDELFFEYDVDHYTNNYIWLQLRPEYEKENPKENNETMVDYTNRILDLYHEDINTMMKSFTKIE